MSAADWPSLDAKHVWHPYTQMATAPSPLPVERAEGAWLFLKDGRRVLDAISSWWTSLHGHNHPRLMRALRRQAEKIDHVIFAGFSHEPGARLAARLSELSPGKLPRVFFSDDGSTAVECALKMAVQYWKNRGQPERTLFVALEGGYHGDTFGAMSAGGVAAFHDAFKPLLFPVARANADAASLEKVLAENQGKVAALILEPMLRGAGGMLVSPREFLVAAREACERHDVLLIADEVLTGFGRTGKLFACEHGPISPDILCLSKALTGGTLPLAATLATEEVYAAFLGDDRARAFLHGHSFTGNPLACAVALESLAVLEDERGLEHAVSLEALYRKRLAALEGLPRVRNARALGMVAAFDLVSEKAGYLDALGPRLQQEFLARGILLRPLGNVVYVLPPLCVTDEEVHQVFDAIEDVVESLA